MKRLNSFYGRRTFTLLSLAIAFSAVSGQPVHAQSARGHAEVAAAVGVSVAVISSDTTAEFARRPHASPVHLTAFGGIGMGPDENVPDQDRPGAIAAGARLAFGSARIRPTVSYTHWFWGPLGGVPGVGSYPQGEGSAVLIGAEYALAGEPLQFEPFGGLEAGVLRWDRGTTPAVAGRLGAQLKLSRILRLSTEARAQLQHVYSGIDSLVIINLGLRLCLPYVHCEL